MDHLIAMIAVGAWSAQLGGRAIVYVPSAFLLMMCAGGMLGLLNVELPFTGYGIALSVIMLGLAIAMSQKASLTITALATGIFGICHGYAHGLEIPKQQNVFGYIAGFLITTFGLHVVGAVGGLLLLDDSNGQLILRRLGLAALVVGVYLCFSCKST